MRGIRRIGAALAAVATAAGALVAVALPAEAAVVQYGTVVFVPDGDTIDVELLLPSITVPVRIVWGENDAWLPPATAERLHELIAVGAEFDRNPDGSLMLTREGGHHANRIVHAGGDATGAEVQRALHAAIHRDPGIRLLEHALVFGNRYGTPRQVLFCCLNTQGQMMVQGKGKEQMQFLQALEEGKAGW